MRFVFLRGGGGGMPAAVLKISSGCVYCNRSNLLGVTCVGEIERERENCIVLKKW